MIPSDFIAAEPPWQGCPGMGDQCFWRSAYPDDLRFALHTFYGQTLTIRTERRTTASSSALR